MLDLILLMGLFPATWPLEHGSNYLLQQAQQQPFKANTRAQALTLSPIQLFPASQ